MAWEPVRACVEVHTICWPHTLEILVGEVEQEDKDDATVISVDNTSTSVNHELGSCVGIVRIADNGIPGHADIPRPLRGATRP